MKHFKSYKTRQTQNERNFRVSPWDGKSAKKQGVVIQPRTCPENRKTHTHKQQETPTNKQKATITVIPVVYH